MYHKAAAQVIAREGARIFTVVVADHEAVPCTHS